MLDVPMTCPDVCVEITSVVITGLTLLFALSALCVFLLRKKILRKMYLSVITVLIMLMLLSFDIKYDDCGSGCATSGTYWYIDIFNVSPWWLH